MNERDRIILSLGDAELLKWWELFGYCPHPQLEQRLRDVLYQDLGRVRLVEPPAVPIDPMTVDCRRQARKAG